MPFFSIIMPAYNAGKYISESIQSIINQTFKGWELIVVNDGSTDDTELIVQEFVKIYSTIKLINQDNKRLGAARNAGINASVGEWITFLDSDDLWDSKKLVIQHSLINKYKNVDVFFSNGYTFFEDKNIKLYYHFNVFRGLVDGKEMYKKLFSSNLIPILSVAIRKKTVEIIGLQKEDKIVLGSEDWDYWLRAAKSGAVFYGSELRLFTYRVHSNSMSGKILTQRLSSLYIKAQNFNSSVLDLVQKQGFFADLWDVFSQLIQEKRLEDASEIQATVLALTDSEGAPIINQIEDCKKWKNIDQKNRATLRFNLVRVVKELGLIFLTNILFPLISYKEKYQRYISTNYVRWKLKDKLKLNGSINISPTASILGGANGGLFECYGLSLHDFSQINLTNIKGILKTSRDVTINKYCHFNIWGKVTIGNNVLFNNYCSLNCLEEITIGDNTWFGEGVRLYDHNHKFRDETLPFSLQGFSTGKISIGSNVWVGANVVILQNVTIGDNCVIGANNLIYKSVPANTIIKSKSMEHSEPIYKVNG